MNQDSPTNSPSTPLRPHKLQKLHVLSPTHNFFYQQPFGEGSSNNNQSPGQDSPLPTQDLHNQYQEDMSPENNNNSDPFYYYQDEDVQESIDQCKNSILGKILSEKPIPTQVLHNTLSGIWCNPKGFKVTELEGKLLQIKMDNEVDLQRILKGSPWIIRNCWLLLHG